MFKGYQDTSNQQQFKGFPNLNMQQATSAYGFSGVTFWLDAAYGLNTQSNLGAVSRWQARVGNSVFEQATAGSQPRLILNDANYNNFPSIEAQDSARVMNASIGLRYNVSSTTIVVISKINTANFVNWVIVNPNATSSGVVGLHDGGNVGGYNGFGNVVSSPLTFFQGTTESTNTRIKIITGTNVIVNGVNETTGNAGSDVTELTRIFTNTGGGGTMLGSIAEIIAFGYSMTSDQAIALSNNINLKYALY